MEEIDKLKAFYTDELLPSIADLEKIRLVASYKVKGVAIFVGLIILACLIGFTLKISNEIFIYLMCGSAIAFFVYNSKFSTQKYYIEYKSRVIKPIINYIDPKLEYLPQRGISAATIKQSELFPSRVNVFNADDLVRGVMGKTDVELCDLRVAIVNRYADRTETEYVNLGVFVCADFNKHFKEKTFVLPDFAERNLGALGTFFQKNNKKYGELVKLESVEFEKRFAVYSANQIEARYILTPNIMEKIVNLELKTKKGLCLSFIDSKVFMFVPRNKPLFEPQITQSLEDFNLAKEYYEDLKLIEDIVTELNLNTRIWTKE